MKEYSYTESRRKLKSVIEEAVNDHEVIRISNRRGPSVIMLDEQDYNSLVETAYLLRSPKNAKRLLEAMKRSKSESIDLAEVLGQLDI